MTKTITEFMSELSTTDLMKGYTAYLFTRTLTQTEHDTQIIFDMCEMNGLERNALGINAVIVPLMEELINRQMKEIQDLREEIVDLNYKYNYDPS